MIKSDSIMKQTTVRTIFKVSTFLFYVFFSGHIFFFSFFGSKMKKAAQAYMVSVEKKKTKVRN